MILDILGTAAVVALVVWVLVAVGRCADEDLRRTDRREW